MDVNGVLLPVPSKILSTETQIRELAFNRILNRINQTSFNNYDNQSNHDGTNFESPADKFGIAPPFKLNYEKQYLEDPMLNALCSNSNLEDFQEWSDKWTLSTRAEIY